jgi:hypothetical protein
MYIGRDFSDMDVGEEENFAFDFESDLAHGETIISTVWSCSLIKELSTRPDPAVSSHLNGAAEVIGTRSIQPISGLVAGNTYLLRADIMTSSGVKSLWSHVKCVRPA